MATNQDQIPILQQMLRSAHQVVMGSIDAITEPEIRQVPAPGEWTVAQLMSHIAEIEYFWMEKAVLITKESVPNITRSDVDRAGNSLEEHIWSLAAANESAVVTTGEISPGDLALLDHRGENNPITVEGVVRFLATHTKEHAHQIIESRGPINRR